VSRYLVQSKRLHIRYRQYTIVFVFDFLIHIEQSMRSMLRIRSIVSRRQPFHKQLSQSLVQNIQLRIRYQQYTHVFVSSFRIHILLNKLRKLRMLPIVS